MNATIDTTAIAEILARTNEQLARDLAEVIAQAARSEFTEASNAERTGQEYTPDVNLVIWEDGDLVSTSNAAGHPVFADSASLSLSEGFEGGAVLLHEWASHLENALSLVEDMNLVSTYREALELLAEDAQ